MAEVTLENVDKVYEVGQEPAVNNLSLQVEDGEFLVFVGPSGCGKSTALRMVAGLEEISAGKISIGDAVVNDLPPQERDLAMVFQNYALYPHMTVRQNLGYPLKVAKLDKQERNERIEGIAKTLQLEEYLDRKPANLSGGQRQRVAMGRALIRRPSLFLMDEPLSNLDAKLRVSMRAEIARIQSELGVTTIYVTHDQVEAMTMGDRVAVLKDGVLQQIDSPEELYNNPVNTFVASFIGSPAMNLFESKIELLEDGSAELVFGSQVLDLPSGLVNDANLASIADVGEPKELICGVRPDNLKPADTQDENSNNEASSVVGQVVVREALGSETLLHLDFGVKRYKVDDPDLEDEAEDLGAGSFIARFPAATPTKVGESVDVAIVADSLHFFDSETGNKL